jgi:hypothetical protein
MNHFLEGYPNVEIIVYTAGAKASAGAATVNLSTSLANCEKVYLQALISNTDTVWVANAATIMSGTGYPFYSNSTMVLEYNKPGSLYITSQGGDSKLSAIFLGK